MANYQEAGAHTGDGDEAETPESRAKFVQDLCEKVKSAKKFHEKPFKRMKEDQEIAMTGTSQQSYRTGKKYVANIIQRHVAQRVSTLYAKNPKAVAERRERRDFRIWDGSLPALQTAYMEMSNASAAQGIIPSPQSMALLQDYQTGMANRKMMESVGDTLVKLFHYFLDEQVPGFKTQMKKLVRRTVVTGVGYVKIGFQREMKRRADVDGKIADATERLGHIERLMAAAQEGEFNQYDAEAEELRLALQTLQNEPMLIVREGLVFDFPEATSIVIDPACKYLNGFIGANWIAHEILMTANDIKEIYGKDIKKGNYTCYNRKGQESGSAARDPREPAGEYCCVWEFYDKTTGNVYALCDGYKDFLEEPTAPNVMVEQFFPIYPLIFNDVESDKEIYPLSDVRLLVPMQDEHNRAREGQREHRQAARPRYVAPKGAMEKEDKDALRSADAHTVSEINMPQGGKVSDMIQPVPVAGVDPNLYVTNHIMEDVYLVVGGQEATTFGGAGGKATATESSIAQGAQMSSIQSNIDDLDDFFTQVARDSGQILMLEMSPEQVIEIVGPGAVWPEMSKEQIVKEVFLKVEAGSSGRPNQAAELANMERVLPYLIQIPGIDPTWLAKTVLRRMDDRLDLADAIQPAMPSITTINGMAQPGTGDPTTSPEQQGGKGKYNDPGGQSKRSGSSAPMGPNNLS